MTNPLDSIWTKLQAMIEEDEDAPLHVGEAMLSWTYLTAMKDLQRYEEIGLNTTTDNEVKDILQDAYKLCESQTKQLEDLLTKEGVPLPDNAPQKPKSSPDDVPPGVKGTDNEITNGLSVKIAAAIVECASGQSQAIRNDIGKMWFEFQTELLTFGMKLKGLMKKRGWLKVPPYYIPPGKIN
ncbi:DUF3231 family protein [Evansella cellulosilytica]|uniref:DUF3231 family protein n=1 Tax=Evansella cellulosilytica (strain ATCC 21833 / DSM 2522 / FERM P-1141 / JCM 9156 / N-4) TaxID=649639 RepID=E6TWF4_EVAC2|nr:DUF3231 family protein [Evansella cellulosilytica]ADU32217.1 hypothetical protein Bcell_3985 [Evansella cellulosilytica DSM 2522]